MSIELKTAAAYIRVSTDKQTELSPDSQIKEIRKYADERGYIVPDEYVFRDDGISGRKAENRPGFINMIAAAKQKPAPFSAVLLWKFSRFARNLEESIFYKSMLKRNGVDVVSISEPLIEGPFGKLVELILGWLDEYYVINLSGEVKSKMIERVSRGCAVSIPPFGYDIVDKKYVVKSSEAVIVKLIFEDYLKGATSKQLARRLNDLGIRTKRGNPWENRTVDYILRNPVYTGKIRWNPSGRTRRNYDDPNIMVVDGIHEPIIGEDSFNKVQAIFEANRKKHSCGAHNKGRKYMYMLHGLVKCSACGGSLSSLSRGTALQCHHYSRGQCAESHCIGIKILDDAVITAIGAVFRNGVFYLNVNDKEPDKKSPELDIESLIRKEQMKYQRIKEAYEDGAYTVEELKERRRKIDERISTLRAQAIKSQRSHEKLRKALDKSQSITAILRDRSVSEEEKNELLRSFIDRIIFDRKASSISIVVYV